MSRDGDDQMPGTQLLQDEFESTLEDARRDPAFRAAYEDAQERHGVLDRLVSLRRALNLPQTAVAARMGVTQPTVSGFETEDSDPRLSTLQRYARAVGARLRLVVTVPRECDWIPEAIAYQRVRPQASAGVSMLESALAENWQAEWRRAHDRWSVPA